MASYQTIQKRLIDYSDAQQAVHLSRFFKTGKGTYGEGDLFRGIRVPRLRLLAKEYAATPPDELSGLLASPYHEDRFLALLLLINAYRKGSENEKKKLYRFYLNHTARINSWDLVDVSAHHIAGAHLFRRDRAPLYLLAHSPLLWDRRISLIATFHFIRNGDFNDTFRLVALLMNDREDLIHKAMGWMLREVGNRDMKAEEIFLGQYHAQLPRTTLRYAIERFPEKKRRAYLYAHLPERPAAIRKKERHSPPHGS